MSARPSWPVFLALPGAMALGFSAQAFAAGLSGYESRQFFFGASELPLSGFIEEKHFAAGDVNCDGATDLIVGDPLATVNGFTRAGRIGVGFGNAALGLRPGGQLMHQDVVGALGIAGVDDDFGGSLAIADFDGDGCADVAVGVSQEDVDGESRAGIVQIFPGGSAGLDVTRDFQIPTGGSAPNGPTAGHAKGTAVSAVGRLTAASALPMLAIGAPGHNLGLALGAGGVSVRRSDSAAGGLGAIVRFIDRNATSFGRLGDSVGSVLASGDFNGDGFGDLVSRTRQIDGCAIPGPTLCLEDRGNLLIAYGASSAGGLTFEELNQNSPGVPGAPVNNALWGSTLAVGDINGDGFDDLAVGAPNTSLTFGGVTRQNTGLVTVLFGASNGLKANAASGQELVAGNIPPFQDTLGGERMASALAIADFDLDGDDDLAIGIPGRRVGTVASAGVVSVVRGFGASAASTLTFTRGIDGVPGPATADDSFGAGLATGDFNDDGAPDLAILTDQARSPGGAISGSATILFSTAETITIIGSPIPTVGVPGQSYTVPIQTVRATGLISGVTRIRGTVQVRASDGSQCTVSPSPSTGLGSCTMTAGAAGVLTLTAEYPGTIGFRPSNAAPRTYTVAVPVDPIFRNSFENP